MTVTSHSERKASPQEQLLQILQMRPDGESCQTCLKQLDDYITAQLAGEDYLDGFPEVAVHLDACPQCAGAYARLYELALADAAGQLPQPEATPQPNLTFLRANRLTAHLKKALRQTDNTLRLQFSAELLALLQPPPFATATRAAAGERYGEVLASLDPASAPDGELPLKFTIYQDAEQPNLCLIEIVIEPAGKSWPDLAGSTVTLRWDDAKREATTDAWGVVSFADIPADALEQMRLEVTMIA